MLPASLHMFIHIIRRWQGAGLLPAVIFIILFLLVLPMTSMAEDPLDFLSDQSPQANDSSDWSLEDFESGGEIAAGERPSPWDIRYSISMDQMINNDRDKTSKEAYVKSELRAETEIKYDLSGPYIYSITDTSILATFIRKEFSDHYRYSNDSKICRNLRITSESAEISFREFYLHIPLESGRIRIGNQLLPWGTADFINSTAYINPQDLREIIFKEQDRIKFGVPSVSVLYFMEDASLELAWIPVHVTEAMPETGTYWSVKKIEQKYPLYFGTSMAMDVNSRNFGYAARLAFSREGYDYSLSAYHGPDREPVLLPYRTVVSPGRPVGVMVRPVYDTVDYIGFDFTTTWNEFSLQVEGAFSPDKASFIKQDTDHPEDLVFPFKTDRSPYFAYSIGINYYPPMHKFIEDHTGDAILVLEWYQARYLDDKLSAPLLTDLLSFRFQDDYFDQRLHLSLSAVFDVGKDGVIFWPELIYDYDDNISFSVSYAAINGKIEGDWEEDSLISYFKDNDFILFTVSYDYP